MDLIYATGYIAAFCSTVAFLPQVWRTYKTRHAHDISYSMLLLLMTGMTLWFIYGLVIGEIPVILANGITLILLFAITTMKIRFP
ncbi:MAG: SemiSWEET transporter [Methanospirillum sp.]|uniref:SemiSWEET transporter n=1 Tax=Methanospirillum sp. TaxID=45200 RepID=UPI00236B3EFB|nr:SemiSWEET transporter [Methanospirillum sp.]MDD1728158.1 SemiSWEET transporter [Methanospirillum sp.]